MTSSRQRVAITGASGLIGGALSLRLRGEGHDVAHFVRRVPNGAHERRWDPAEGYLDAADLADIDTVVHLAGAGVGDHRWTSAYKETIRSSRVDGTDLVSRVVAAGAGPNRLITASAIGIYGDRGDEVLTEQSSPGSGFLADVVREWEAASAPATDAGIPVAQLRTGIVLSAKGGALTPMLRLGRLGLGGPLGSGRQWMPWITLADTVSAYVRLIEDPSITGPVNATAPHPVRQRELARAIGRKLKRPAILPAPALAMRLILGEFAGDVLASAKVIPEHLDRVGFTHQHPTVEDALDHLLGS